MPVRVSLSTLGQVRPLLWPYWSGDTAVPYASRTAADTAAWDAALNQASERLIRSGKWRSSIVRANFTVVGYQVTLPESLDCILGVTPVDSDLVNSGYPLSVHGPWHEFIPNGPGKMDGSCGLRGLIDLGDQFATFRESPYATFTIKATCDLTESGKTILLRGLDQNRKVVFSSTNVEGVSLNLNSTTPETTTQQFTYLSYWVKSAATNGVVRLYAVDTATAEQTVIAIIMPGKLVSGYRRYRVPFGEDGDVIETICKRDFVPILADNDPIFPSNLGALKKALQALRFEDKVDDERAANAWAGALRLLEDEQIEYEGDNVSTSMQFEGVGCLPCV